MTERLPPPALATEAVDAIEHLNGVHPGHRRVHARGVCFEGSFTPTGDAAALTTAAHLQSAPVPATVRFSHTSSNPHVADGLRGARGMAVRFHLADGAATDIVSITMPAFIAPTPQAFLGLIGALEKDPATGAPDPVKLKQYAADHPSAALVLQAGRTMGIPASYGAVRYWACHAFTWVNADGERRSVRYRWEPEAGVRELTEEEGAAEEPDFLAQELTRRLGDGPVGFTLRVQLAEDGDPTHDSTVQWPADRTEIVAGRLELTAAVADQAHGEAQIFDPTRITDGIELSDDPILAFRRQAYAVSYERRSDGR